MFRKMEFEALVADGQGLTPQDPLNLSSLGRYSQQWTPGTSPEGHSTKILCLQSGFGGEQKLWQGRN